MNASDSRTFRTLQRDALAEAAAWIAKLHGPERSPELEADFRGWLDADPEHARAFEAVTNTWDAIATVDVGGLPRVSLQRSSRGVGQWPRFAAALIVSAILAVGVYWLVRDPSYSTGIGEQRVVRLDDGSYVSLNSATRVAVAYRKTERRVRLTAGEAFFQIAPNRERPFVVIVGDHKVTALGTSFVVRYEPNRMAVTLVEGKVTVMPLEAGASSVSEEQQARTLHPGERLTVAANRAEHLDRPPVEAVAAWRRGEVVLDDTPLADAVAEMNRYDRTLLVLEGERTRGLRVSGIYRTGDSAGFAHAVASMYGLAVERHEDELRLRDSQSPVR